jgi:hypothetical protein
VNQLKHVERLTDAANGSEDWFRPRRITLQDKLPMSKASRRQEPKQLYTGENGGPIGLLSEIILRACADYLQGVDEGFFVKFKLTDKGRTWAGSRKHIFDTSTSPAELLAFFQTHLAGLLEETAISVSASAIVRQLMHLEDTGYDGVIGRSKTRRTARSIIRREKTAANLK